MRLPIRAPQGDPDGHPVRLLRWLARDGEHLDAGQSVALFELDKATIELEAHASGVLITTVVTTPVEMAPHTVIGFLRTADREVHRP